MDELALLNAIQETWRTPLLDGLMIGCAWITTAGALWLLAGAILAALPSYRRHGVAVILAVLVASAVAKLILGEVFQRPRPCDVAPWVPLLVDRPFGWSFPSGHATTAFAAAAALATVRVPRRAPRWLTVAFFILAILIGFSRVYLYVHYPSDVLAGALIGLICYSAGRSSRRP